MGGVSYTQKSVWRVGYRSWVTVKVSKKPSYRGSERKGQSEEEEEDMGRRHEAISAHYSDKHGGLFQPAMKSTSSLLYRTRFDTHRGRK